MSAFSPAIKFANRISFTQKLLILVFCFLIPCVIALTRDIASQQQKMTEHQLHLEGVNLAFHLKQLMLLMAKHRGNMAQHLNGDETKVIQLSQLEQEIDDLVSVIPVSNFQHEFDRDSVKKIMNDWTNYKVNTIKKDPKASFQGHTQLIARTRSILDASFSHYQLELSGSIREYHMALLSLNIIPALQEYLGQLRGKGSGALVDKNINLEESKDLSDLSSAVNFLLINFNNSLGKLTTNTDTAVNKLKVSSQEPIREFLNQTRTLLNTDLVTLTNGQFFEKGTEAITALEKIDSTINSEFLTYINDELNAARLARNLELLMALVALSLGCYFAMGILLSLNENVKEINKTTENLKNGNFSYLPQVKSHDVIGEVSQHLVDVIRQIGLLLTDIKSSALSVNDLSQDLKQATFKVRHELDSQNSQTIQAASASTQMASTAREVAVNCVDASRTTEHARSSALQGENKVREAVIKINKLGEEVGSAKDNINQLQDDVQSISAVLEVIRSIAEQTNLLALNAAIEAARAGEQGRGFAVVADEVRSLAKRTQDSTSEIKTVIERLQSRAQSAVAIINQSFASASDSVASAAGAGEQLKDIVQSVSLMTDYNTQIATAAEEQATVAEQMSRNTRQLSDSAETILDQVNKTQDYAEKLQRGAHQLNDGILKFKI